MSSIQNLKITTLAENLVLTKCLGQWGLSFVLEFLDAKGDQRKVVFDTGIHKKSLLYNVKQLDMDLSDVDCIVISHGHGDHTASTVEVVKAAGGVKVHAHPHTFLPRYYQDISGKRRKHGIPKGEGFEEIEKAGGRVLSSAKPVEILPGVWTTGEIQRITSFERPLPLPRGKKMIIVVYGEEVEDKILDDQALWMDVKGAGSFVITGCAHAGPINTLLQVQRLGKFNRIYGLVGGTHLVGRSEEYFNKTVKDLKQFGLSLLSPCHCTGFKATSKLWQQFPNEFVLNFSGRVIDVSNPPKDRVI
jgi:7,8-dihydropterin-6-yl-methyl-4-(beta-D-ribofuranosyl)aminobenzene 5'-phosphate synthase